MLFCFVCFACTFLFQFGKFTLSINYMLVRFCLEILQCHSIFMCLSVEILHCQSIYFDISCLENFMLSVIFFLILHCQLIFFLSLTPSCCTITCISSPAFDVEPSKKENVKRAYPRTTTTNLALAEAPV